ncbi:MAG: hypothetical protein JNK21_12430 [Rhodospirillaceae bacterium]|nr:hypothetical protein [Rhodospirillaceae bacterium]
MKHSRHVRFIAATAAVLALTSLSLQGCVAVNAAAAVSRAVVGTTNAVSRTVTAGTNSVVRSVQRIPAAMMYNTAPRQVVVPIRTTRTTATAPRMIPRSTSTAAAAARKAPPRKMSKERSEILEVLPPELLDQLTKDQIILQSMVQKDALEGPGDETVFWDLEGRAGTAFAEAPVRTGGFTCRVIVETLKIDDSGEATESRATVCKTESTSWTLSF